MEQYLCAIAEVAAFCFSFVIPFLHYHRFGKLFLCNEGTILQSSFQIDALDVRRLHDFIDFFCCPYLFQADYSTSVALATDEVKG